MTIALYAAVFTLAFLITCLLSRQHALRMAARLPDRTSDHELAHWRYSWNASRVHEAVPTTPIMLSDINAIADRFICPICDNDRMECTCYASGRIS